MGKGGRGVGSVALVALLAAGATLLWLARGGPADEHDRARTGPDAQAAVPLQAEMPALSPMDQAAGTAPTLPEPIAPASDDAVVETEVPQEPGQPLRLSGRVVDGAGRPVPEATVRLLPSGRQIELMKVPFRPFEPRLTREQLVATVSGPDGTFVLDGRDVPPDAASTESVGKNTAGAEVDWPVLLVSHPAFEATASTCLGWMGGPYAAGDIVLGVGASITARTVDEDGRAHPDVVVAPAPSFDRYDRPGDWEAVKTVLLSASDGDGRVRLDGLWSGKMTLQFRAPGRMASLRRLELKAGDVVDLGDVILAEGGKLEGSVFDAQSGLPVPRARVLARPPMGAGLFAGPDSVAWAFTSTVGDGEVILDRDTLADEQGRFRLSGLDPAPGLDVLAGAAGYEPVKLPAIQLDGEPLNITLGPAGLIILTVVDADSGEPIVDATVEARRHADDKDWSSTKLDVISDSAALRGLGVPEPHAGVFVLSPAGSHRNTAIITAPGHATRGAILPTVVAPERAAQTVKMLREVGYGGRVLDDEGRPIARAKVNLHPPEDLRVKLPDRSERTDTDGRFRFAGLMHGDWDVTASAEGFITSTSRLVKLRLSAPAVEEEFVLQRGGVITGIVLAGPAPSAGIEVAARSLAAAQAQRAAEVAGGGKLAVKDKPEAVVWTSRSDTAGRFRIEGLPPDVYELTGPPGVPLQAQVAAGETTDVTLLARGRPRVRGRVFDAIGPVAGATVGADLLIGPLGGFLEGGGSAITGLDGLFDLELFEPGQVRVAARQQDASTPGVDLDVTWDDVQWVDLRFGGGALQGVVVGWPRTSPLPARSFACRCKWRANPASSRTSVAPPESRPATSGAPSTSRACRTATTWFRSRRQATCARSCRPRKSSKVRRHRTCAWCCRRRARWRAW